jgi:hypothetical protein
MISAEILRTNLLDNKRKMLVLNYNRTTYHSVIPSCFMVFNKFR